MKGNPGNNAYILFPWIEKGQDMKKRTTKAKGKTIAGDSVAESVILPARGGKRKRSSVVVDQFSVVEELKEMDRTIPTTEKGQASCLGISALTFPALNNSMRGNMFTSHVNQFLNLTSPDVPYVFTGAENTAGEYSSSYLETDAELEIIRKIVKFEGIVENPNIYVLFILRKDTKEFDVIKRDTCEDLTENFGFNLDNRVIDSFQEGDTIPAGTTLFRSVSYDDNMNYGYGQNIPIMYTLDSYTSEDACVISHSLAQHMQSIETETLDIPLNDNDFLLNIYGDDYEYKAFPDVGEYTKGNRLMAVRRLYNNQVLFDFKKRNLTKTTRSDITYYIDGKQEIVDITIYSNNDTPKKNTFYEQVNKYLDGQNEYYKEILETCKYIRKVCKEDPEYHYSRDVDYYYKRAKEMLDKKKKFKFNDSAFSNMLIRVRVRRVCNAEKGQKTTPRYGNKSVVAQIRPDSAMPYTKDGRRIHMMINLLAIINRTTAMPTYEILMTHIAWKARQQMAIQTTLKKKEHILFELIKDFNEHQYAEMYKTYKELSTEEKKEYIKDAIEDGIYINEKPMFADTYLFYRVLKILDKYDWIMNDSIYVNKWGRKIRCMRKASIGWMYVMKLKQTDRRGYSARNTGAVDITGLPTRRYKSRSHLEQTSSTAIRFGNFETLNFSIGLLPEDIAILHALYRTSIKGRGDFLKAVVTNTPLDVALDDEYISRAAELMNVKFKALGVQGLQVEDDNSIVPFNDSVVTPHTYEGKEILCTNFQYFILTKKDEIKNEILETRPFITKNELIDEIIKVFKKRYRIVGLRFDEECNLALDSISIEDNI